MAQITAALVKELRELSGAGMMDCKKALSETDGEIEAAVDWLRTKGLAAAAKKAGRVAAEGLVGVAVDGGNGAIVEVNSETDFVARNETFQGFVASVAKLALNVADMDALKTCAYPGTGRTVGEELTHLISTIGENMSLRRMDKISVAEGVVAPYVHNASGEGVGKIGVLVAIKSRAAAEPLIAFAKQIAMHVAATNPASLSRDDLDPALIEREKAVIGDQARESGRPEEIIAKMIEGRIRKYYEEVCLMEQTFVIDGENKVAKAVELKAKELGAELAVGGFIRFGLGEGIDKKEDDFAAEVAAAAGA
ncbi:translation elongation factor Ts [Varunaivibrio sulfuroxidans]|uniref:Elongation factor Ts n=1 Tax=Varunaivibrio sulfuroxidans TaxID=1773489 RepID=A0A4R3JED1_9PROT|nr:translation elongation factor Ts [Varunaivibrio sulfuroxidans]TCS64154.1 translation elongation factor Ts (EF-Ts) [Varunaivibrio sulfuroxidans]WES31399.1 translation elongation factor Ts [Varunaivibrio sulfuroxidans]